MPVGGAFCLVVGRPGSGALPPPTTCPFRRAAAAHYRLAVGAGAAGVGTRHQPHSARSYELDLRAVGAAGGRPGGAPLARVWGVRGRALSHPRPLVLSGVRPGPTTDWLWVRGVRAWGPVTNPTVRALASWLCTLSGRHEGARGRNLLPGRLGLGALPAPTACPLGRAAGAHYPLAVGAGSADVGTRHQPQSARSCELDLRCGGGTRAPGGGSSCLCVGCPGSGALPTPTHSSFRACRRGLLPTGLGCGGCGPEGPSPSPQRALWRARFARSGGGMRAPGGGASYLGVGRTGSGALPPPTTRPFGRAAGVHYPLAVGEGGAVLATRHQPHSARSCELASRCVGGMRVPGGGTSCLGVGRPGSGALLPPTIRPFGRAAGAHYPLTLSAWGAGVGTVTNPTARALACWLCALWGRHDGARGGDASCLGVRGPALSHPRPLVLTGVRPGPTTHWLWVRGVRAWGPVTNPTARALASCALRAVVAA